MHVDSEYVWISPDESVLLPFSRQRGDVLLLASRYDLAVSGDALAYVESIGLAPLLIPLCQVSGVGERMWGGAGRAHGGLWAGIMVLKLCGLGVWGVQGVHVGGPSCSYPSGWL